MSLLFPAPPPDDAPRTGQALLSQDKYWVTRGEIYLLIEEMPLGHVTNCMDQLKKRSGAIALAHTGLLRTYAEDASDGAYWAVTREIDAIEGGPEKWIKSTPLYRALKKRRKALRKGRVK